MTDRLPAALRHAARRLVREPGFVGVAVATLALGIGANAAIFTVLDRVVLSPLPYPEPERLVRVYEADREDPERRGYLSVPDYRDARERIEAFDGLAALYTYRETGRDLTGEGPPRRIRVLPVSHGYFGVYGATPRMGRGFRAAEERPEARAVVLSHRLWRDAWNADPSILGRAVRLDGVAHEVVGVMRPGFLDVVGGDVDAWVPLDLSLGGSHTRGNHFLTVVGRLRPEATLTEARTALDALNRTIVETDEQVSEEQILRIVPLHEDVVGEADTLLFVLMGAAALVLLIACVNVASLFLARTLARGRELSIRAALGSGRGRLLLQLLTEASVIALLGGVAGVMVAAVGVEILVGVSPEAIARVEEVAVDGRLLGGALVASVATLLLFALGPALSGARVELASALREGGRSVAGSRRTRRTRSWLVASQVGLAALLLTGAGVLLRNLRTLRSAELGFEPESVTSFEVHLPEARYDARARTEFHRTLHDQIGKLPEVEAVGAISRLPATGLYHQWGYAWTDRGGERQLAGIEARVIEGDYFEALDIELVAGRRFRRSDDAEAPKVVILNRAAAERAFPGGRAVGAVVSTAGADRRVVGVVEDVAYDVRGHVMPKFYVPHAEYAADRNWALTQVVRVRTAPSALVPAVRRELAALDPELVLYEPRALVEVVARGLARERFAMTLMMLFAGLALVLAVVGIYGVLAYSVAQRRREIGVRMALGARTTQIARLVVRQGGAVVATGLAVGLVGAWWLTRFLESLVHGVGVRDPLVFGVVGATLALAAAAAGWVPARRAVRVDPMEALRDE